MTMKPDFLQRVLNGAEVHHETQGTRIVYDTASFSLTAEVPEGNDVLFRYEAYNMDGNEIKLSNDEMTTVFEFVKNLHDTNKEKDLQLRNQF